MIQELVRPLAQLQLKPVSSTVQFVRTATKRAAGSRTSMKDSAGRRLGSKAGDGQLVRVGEIIYRQRGTKIFPGENMGIGRDHTLFAKEPGFVRYYYDPFHPKRKLVGIAFEKHTRLPTPHFAPTPRRFGYELIEDEEKAERELTVMKRKEYLARSDIDKVFNDREAKRQQRINRLVRNAENLGVELPNDEVKKLVGERLLAVQNYLNGGRSVEEAKGLADRDVEQDAKIAKEFRNDESLLGNLSSYNQLCTELDSKVTFDPEYRLCKYHTQEELDTMAKVANEHAAEIVANGTGTISRRRNQIEKALRQPCFSLKTRNVLMKRYTTQLFAPLAPQALPVEEMEKLVKSKKGKIVKNWNYEKRQVDQLYVPFV